jgi:hypothetical protein
MGKTQNKKASKASKPGRKKELKKGVSPKPAKEKKPKSAKQGKKVPAKDPTLQSNLAVEAHHIRMILREISQHFVSDQESQVVRTIELVGQIPNGSRKQAEMEKIIRNMRNLKVKPNKGRLRDLKEIRDLIQQTNQRLEELL